MVFSTNAFIFLFLPIVLAAYYITRNRIVRNITLAIASLLFYAWGEPVFVLLLILSVLINFYMALLIEERNNKKLYLIIAIVYNLLLLIVFKYMSFVLKDILHININLKIHMPIGISFYTFQAISYVVDVYRKTIHAEHNFLDVALYISFFPQLIAGPIVRAKDFIDQIHERCESTENIYAGIIKFIGGLSKKIIIANNLAYLVDFIFEEAGNTSVATAWLGAISYSLQIYFDFSGYSDMAIGLAQMFGFSLLENFNYPYISKSITEFWRRWHISLSTWFKDYVYIPMGGNKCSKRRNMFNLMVVWTLTGIWHGANWTFLIWGCSYYLIILLEKNFFLGYKKISFLNTFTTFSIVTVLWVFFRADSVSIAVSYIANMLGINGVLIDDGFYASVRLFWIYIVIGIITAVPFSKIYGKHISIKSETRTFLEVIIHIVLFLICISFLLKNSYNPFIYFNF